jgi:hypothetical protein
MGNTSNPLTLSRRTQALYAVLDRAAAMGALTPTNDAMVGALRLGGHDISDNKGAIGYELNRLERAGKIRVIGALARRVFEIVATGQRTRRRRESPDPASVLAMLQANGQHRMGKAAWPRPTEASIAAYEAAMAKQPYGPSRPALPRASTPHIVPRSSGEARSLIGCSAALVAA